MSLSASLSNIATRLFGGPSTVEGQLGPQAAPKSVLPPAVAPVTVAATPINPDDKTVRIVLLLDESGSMGENKLEVIQAINGFIDEQKKVKTDNPCLVTLVKFSGKVEVVYADQPLNGVHPLTDLQYIPGGMTALYDAIGTAFEKFGMYKNVVLVVMTDGEENSSKEYNQLKVKKLIDEHKNQSTFAWNVIYLSADPTLAAQGNRMGMGHDAACGSSNVSTQFNNLATYCTTTLSRGVSDYRSGTTRTVKVPPSA
jgi:uncharacterized protein YegL